MLGSKRVVNGAVNINQLIGLKKPINQLISRLIEPRVTSRGVYSIYTP